MSNGKKWRDGKKVRNDNSNGYKPHVMGQDHNKHKNIFRAKMKNGKYGDDEMTHISMGKAVAYEIWNWD